MPLFSFASPFDADVEKATNEKNASEDWGLILDICDKVGRQQHGARDCLKSITKRLHHKVPFVTMQALTLLDACMNNCGRVFHVEVCTRDFMNECRTLLSAKAHPKVSQKLRFFVKKWAEMPEIKNDKSLSLISAMYESLRRGGADFSDPNAAPARAVSPEADVAREEEDISRAIALSLEKAERVKQAKAAGLYPPTPWAAPYPDLSHTDVTGKAQETDRVRALYDFEAAEDNELTFKAGELINVTDDSDSNWWKGFTSRGEGLFPTNFVTTDLSVDPCKSDSEMSAGQEAGAEGSTVDHVGGKVDINEGLIDEALALVRNADPTGESQPDTPEMLRLEATCRAMGPLIDSELEKVDRDISQLVELNYRVKEALQMYHSLMQENTAYTAATRLPPGPHPAPYPPPVTPPGQPAMYSGQQMYFGSPGVPPMTVPAAGPPPSQPPPSPAPPPTPATQDPVVSDPVITPTTDQGTTSTISPDATTPTPSDDASHSL